MSRAIVLVLALAWSLAACAGRQQPAATEDMRAAYTVVDDPETGEVLACLEVDVIGIGVEARTDYPTPRTKDITLFDDAEQLGLYQDEYGDPRERTCDTEFVIARADSMCWRDDMPVDDGTGHRWRWYYYVYGQPEKDWKVVCETLGGNYDEDP